MRFQDGDSNQARHVMETIKLYNSVSQADHSVIDEYLTHSADVAKRVYKILDYTEVNQAMMTIHRLVCEALANNGPHTPQVTDDQPGISGVSSHPGEGVSSDGVSTMADKHSMLPPTMGDMTKRVKSLQGKWRYQWQYHEIRQWLATLHEKPNVATVRAQIENSAPKWKQSVMTKCLLWNPDTMGPRV